MSEPTTLILFVAEDGGETGWLLGDGDRIVARGADLAALPPGDYARVVAIAPADAASLHWAELPDLAKAQARAAARLLVSENSLAPAGSLHVALGRSVDGEADRAIGAVAADRIAGWIASFQALGFDPDSIVPAPLLLPRPDEAYVAGAPGGQPVLRGHNSGFADEPGLSDHIVGDSPVATIDGEALDASILVAIADPVLDLRQGAFAKRQPWRLDWPLVRRLGLLALAIAGVTLLIGLVLIARYSFAAERLEMQAEVAARAALPRGAADGDPVAALDARLADLRGGGLGFSATAGALFGAVQATPNVELTALDFGADGLLRATIAASGAAEAEALRARIEEAGLNVEASPFRSEAGRITGEFRIGGR